MMFRPFQFSPVPRIIFKCGGIDELPSMVSLFGKNLILVTGKNSFDRSEQSGPLIQRFGDHRINYHRIIVSGEPSPEFIDATVKKYNHQKTDLVVGIGGGSTLDTAKAISAMLHKDGSVIDYLEGVGSKKFPGTKVPFIAVPTTSGTGSEATKNAVISKVGNKGFKKSLRHDNLVPDIALLDPVLTLSCPPDVTAASGMDCFTQLTEAYLSEKSCEYTDILAVTGLRAIKSSLLRAYSDGSDIDARSGMSFAALTSGICLSNAGLGVVHGLAGEMGAFFNIPHGIACGTIMAISNEENVSYLRRTDRSNAALKKYAFLGELFIERKGKPVDYYIDGFISFIHELTEKLRLPVLKEFGIDDRDAELIASKADLKNNPARLPVESLKEIIRKRIK